VIYRNPSRLAILISDEAVHNTNVGCDATDKARTGIGLDL
jgi:hypothetical protein